MMDARSVSCVGPSMCMATGSDHDLLYTVHPNGVRWRRVDIPLAPGADPHNPGNPGNAVDCVAVDWCIAVGFDVTMSGSDAVAVSVWNGRAWTSRLEPAHRPSGGIDGQQVSCWAVGECRITAFAQADSPVVVRAHVLRWFHGQVTDSRPFGSASETSDFPYISCTSDDHCIALGSWSATGVLHQREQTAIWDGTTWSRHPSRYPGPPGARYEPVSLSCLSAHLCVTTGVWEQGPLDDGIEVWSAHVWTRRSVAPAANDATLDDVTCLTADKCFAVGSYDRSGTTFGYIDAGAVTP